MNNNSVGAYDESIYSLLEVTNKWEIIPPIIDKKDFIGWGFPGVKENCMDYAKAQIAIKGFKISNYFDVDSKGEKQTFQLYTEKDGVNLKDLKKGFSYLVYALRKKIPVIIGIDNHKGSSNPNTDKTTDHFVVVVGIGNDFKGNYIQFYDNASGDADQGTNYLNRLYFDSKSNKFIGNSQTNYAIDNNLNPYTLTMIRKSKK